jgi:alkanesulfonate monooxygenase SsuD/methylene tetrahydromethanopterin reductase-like flavin-dependent oxidoreductase (luciferase family)
VGDLGHDLQFGVFITPANAQPDAVVDLAVRADEAGLDLVSFQDHPYQPRFLETWTLLAFVAARTQRVRLAPNVLSVPLRPPAVLARAAASLDLLSGGRVELGLGAGGFRDAIAAIGGPRLTAGESVEALEESIDVIRAIWDTGEPRGVRYDGRHHRLEGAKRGPAPPHPIGLYLGAYKPRMLALTGRKGDGWWPSRPYLEAGDLAAGNAAVDTAARAAGRDPADIRRLLNLGRDESVDELVRLALEDGIGTFVFMTDDAAAIDRVAAEIAPAVRERVAAARAGAAPPGPPASALWDENDRPRRDRSRPQEPLDARGRAVGAHLVEVHDMLRRELTELRDVVAQVRSGALEAGEARTALNAMALRQNDWTLGAFCSRFCFTVAQHHTNEDVALFPHLRSADAGLAPVIDRLADEHEVIHHAIERVDRALVAHIEHPDDFRPLQSALDELGDALLSHLGYEEEELVDPLGRHGFMPGQV